MPTSDECFEYFKSGDFERAIDCLTQVIKIDLNDAQAFILRGFSQANLHRYESALSDYDRAIDIDPNLATAFGLRGLVKTKLRHYEFALSDYNRAIELDPYNAPTFANRGIVKLNLHHYESSLSDFDRAIELDPNFAAAFSNRGKAKDILCRHEFALSDYDRAIEIDPSHAQVFSNRGIVKAKLRRYESALSDFDRAIELDPNYAPAFDNRGIVQANLHRYESALSDYDRAIELDPNYAPAFDNRGIVQANLHRYESALSDFDRAIEIDTNRVSAFFNRGLAKAELRRYESAICDYDRAIEIDTNYVSAFVNRGAAKTELHHYESALSDFDRAIEIAPNYAPAFLSRGFTKFNLCRYESALSDFDRAMKFAPELSLSYFGKGQTLWIGMDNLGAAQMNFNRFIFLAEIIEIIKYWNPTHDFYARHAAAPFLLNRLFEILPDIGNFLSWQGTLHETERQCRTLKNYLQHLRDTGEPERDAPQFHRLEALVHYFMGDPMEAYRIYDRILDGELECLDLMDSYYYLSSAAEFLEPDEGIQHFALKQADEFLKNTKTEGDERERYYAGQLYALGGDWEKALEAFAQAEAFFPAAVMRAVAADRLGKPQADIESLWEKAKQLAAPEVSGAEAGINGFPEIRLELGREDYLTPFRQYAHYQEIAEHLHLFWDDSAPFHVAEFWKIWRLTPEDEREIWWQLRKKELERIEAELQSYFTQNLEAQYTDYTPEQLQNLEKLLSDKDKAVQAVFEKLKIKSATSSEALEHQFGLEIDAWELRSAHAYALMLKYFFLSKHLEDKPAFLLYFYNDYIASKRQRDYTAAKESYVEGSQPVFSLLVNMLLRMGDVASAVAAGALSVLTAQFFHQDQEPLDEDDPTSNYQKFKSAFLKFLSYEMESMGREKFLVKYPLEGWEDWKKSSTSKSAS